MRLTDDMKRVLLEQRLGFVATVTPDGRPNLSPKGTTTVFDDRHLMFLDVASPGTIANLATNPFLEINVVDPIIRKGYRFKGIATVLTSGERFEEALATLWAAGSTIERSRVCSIVLVEITDATALISPAYDAGATEHDIARGWLGRIAERHRELITHDRAGDPHATGEVER